MEDKGYDAEALRQYCDRYRMQPVIPYRAMKRKPKPGLPRLFDKPKYRERNFIERLFGWLKEYRRIGLLPAVSTTLLFVQCLAVASSILAIAKPRVG